MKLQGPALDNKHNRRHCTVVDGTWGCVAAAGEAGVRPAEVAAVSFFVAVAAAVVVSS